jgi:hypothetical protein
LNGFDVPKIYFHEFYPAKKIHGKLIKYAIIDGKQRMQTIWSFIRGDIALDNQFQYYRDPKLNLGGLTYPQIAEKYPDVKDYFNGIPLPVYCILTDDVEIIEDMFSRLNEAVPLNAAEKRNAYGGLLPAAIKRMAKDAFFARKIPFKNSRFRHLDLACKFLYLAHRGNRAEDTKRRSLDEYVKSHPTQAVVTKAFQGAERVLKEMNRVFAAKDDLLRSIGIVTAYYLLFADCLGKPSLAKLRRPAFTRFEALRLTNREKAESEDPNADYELIEYDRLSQSPNDKVAIEFRLKILKKHLLAQ